MAWSGDFLAELLEDVLRPIYVLETVQIGVGQVLGGQFQIASAAIPGAPTYEVCLSPQGSSISAGRLNITDLTYTVGQWQIGILSNFANSIREFSVRGQAVALKIGFPGWSIDDFQTVALGQIQNINRNGEMWIIQVRSLLGGLSTRWSETIDVAGLFYHLPLETYATVAYTAGVSATLTVNSATGVVGEGAAKFILRVTPDDGDALYLYCATRAGAVFTVTSSLFDVSTNVEDEVPAVAKSVAVQTAGEEQNNVEIGVLIKSDNPAKIARKVLCSTGAGTNGTFDTLPAAMGLNILEEHFDTQNYPLIEVLLGSTTADDDLYAYSFDVQTDAQAWIASVLAPFGGFLCEREGQISIGVLSDQGIPVNAFAVEDDELVEISYEAWSSEQPVEYGRTKGVLPLTENEAVGFVSAVTGSRPNVDKHTTEFPYVNGAAEAEWLVDGMTRIERFRRVVGEMVTITTRGWRLASAAPGDQIYINTSRLTGRTLDSNLGQGGACHILSVNCNWFGSSTEIRAIYFPLVSG